MTQKYKRIFSEIAGNVLKTDRLEIRRWRADEVEQMSAFYNRDERAFPRYIDWPDGDYSVDYMRGTVLDHLDKISPHERAIFRDKEIIGVLLFWQDHARRPRLSYYITPSERGKGYGYEAYIAGLREFGGYGAAKSMIAEVKPDNLASQRLLLKASFNEAGKIISKSGVLKGTEVVLFRRNMADLSPGAGTSPH